MAATTKGVSTWLAARPAASRDPIEAVDIDASAAFAKAIRTNLPAVAISVDAFHLVKLANDTVTAVRQRLSQQNNRRRSQQCAWTQSSLLSPAVRPPRPSSSKATPIFRTTDSFESRSIDRWRCSIS